MIGVTGNNRLSNWGDLIPVEFRLVCQLSSFLEQLWLLVRDSQDWAC